MRKNTKMTFKRNITATVIGKDHPMYIENIPQCEVVVSNDKDEHWLFYISPKAGEDIMKTLEIIDNFDDDILDLISGIWSEAQEKVLHGKL